MTEKAGRTDTTVTVDNICYRAYETGMISCKGCAAWNTAFGRRAGDSSLCDKLWKIYPCYDNESQTNVIWDREDSPEE